MTKTEVSKIADSLTQAFQKKLKGPTKSAPVHARYVGAQGHEACKADERSRLEFWGHQVPTHRALAKTKWKLTINGKSVDLSSLLLEDQWDVWLTVWKSSKIYEIKSIAMIWLAQPKLKALRRKNADDLFAMASDIDNWAHSDSLSSLLAEILEEETHHLTKFKKWNSSKNPWLRRQSIVGLYCYARMRKKHIPAKTALAMIEPLLEDPHFYVQRGVGWTLREVDRVDSKLQREFVRKNLGKIGGVAWFATSELYPPALKKELVGLRKEGRSHRSRRS
jgi:3-methyladenine DNA glycosylase AlkD